VTSTLRRTTLATLSAAAAVLVAAPAFATPPAQTSLNLRAAKTVVKAHNALTFTATLTSKGNALDGQTVALQERTAPTTGHQTTWTSTGATGTNTSGGHYTFTVTPPIAAHKNAQKDQYRAVFTKTDAYGGSHSQVVTITVKRG